ncbi:MAG: pyridoxal 5'-phosphate synthase glutaminase subunit PdxT [Actinomycetota bacterium]|nr:pyridoxal 5'-phosphate synthase glutaminase subunit PdxT [Actinomycetota bacterium]
MRYVGPTVGVLALQGDVAEHVRVLETLRTTPLPVRRAADLDAVDALVLPGGESTTMITLAKAFDLLEPLRERIRAGLPAFGTCAGMILLADRIEGGTAGQESIGGLDVTVRRNAFGRQVDSCETDVPFAGLDRPFHAVLIRAPWVEKAGAGVEVLARVEGGPADGRIVAVRQGVLLATAFHPEVSGDDRIHRWFVDELVRWTP